MIDHLSFHGFQIQILDEVIIIHEYYLFILLYYIQTFNYHEYSQISIVMINSHPWKWSMMKFSSHLHKYTQSLLLILDIQALPEIFDEL